MIFSRIIATLALATFAAGALAASPRVVTITPTPASAGSPARLTLDGTSAYTVTPTPDGKTTISQGGGASATFSQKTFTAITSGDWPSCGAAPAPETRQTACPSGSGTFAQSHGWTPSAWPQCWTAAPWLPSSPPAGACASAPPPSGLVVDYSTVNTGSPEFARFKVFVDAAVAHPNDSQTPYLFGAMDAAAMYRMIGGEQYRTLALATVDRQVADANAKIAAGQTPAVAGDSYLGVGGMIGDLAAAMAWCNPSDAQRAAWSAYARQAIFNVWNPTAAQWGGHAATWSGWAVNDPANNYFYSFVRATMFYGLASGDTSPVKNGKSALDYLRTDRLPLLTSFYATIGGGGSLEGTGYGLSHMVLFELYQVWKDSGQGDLANLSTHLTKSIDLWAFGTTPDLSHVAPFGDQSRVSDPTVYDYHRRNVIEARELSTDVGDVAVADWWLRHIPIQQVSGFGTRYNLGPVGAGNVAPSALTYRAPEVGAIFSRASWTDPQSAWMAALFGNYSQSHAHQEQGGFTLYWRGAWQAVTGNVWSHSGINQSTVDKNVVRFEKAGAVIPQRNGVAHVTAYAPGAAGAFSVMGDLSPLYASQDVHWSRALDWVPSGVTHVADSLTLGPGVSAVFQLNVPAQPAISGNVATAGALKMTVTEPANATLTAVDMRTVPGSGGGVNDYNKGWRIDVRGGTTAYKVTIEPTP